MKTRLFLVALTIIALEFHSCQKDKAKSSSAALTDANLTTNLKAAVSGVLTILGTQASTEDVQSVVISKFNMNEAVDQSNSSENIHGEKNENNGQVEKMIFDIPLISACAIVTISSDSYPRTITIDYGSGCYDGKGPVKKGKIIINISDTSIIAGSAKTITTEDFYMDSTKIDFSSILSNLGKNESGSWVIASSSNQKVTTQNGDIIIEASSDTTEWISGFATISKSDDIFYKSGSGTVCIDDSIVYSRTITKPLLYNDGCGYIVSGTIDLTRKNDTVIIDYGDGTCDNKATVTTNGTTEEINLSSLSFKEGGRFNKNFPKWNGGKRQKK
jgi:hypothetical protein